jgi:hypothetical protein
MCWCAEFAAGGAVGALIFFSLASGGFLAARGGCTVIRVSIGLAPVPLSLAVLVDPLPAFSLPPVEMALPLPCTPLLPAAPLAAAPPPMALAGPLALSLAAGDAWSLACVGEELVVVVSLTMGALALAAGAASSPGAPLAVRAPPTTMAASKKPSFTPISLVWLMR